MVNEKLFLIYIPVPEHISEKIRQMNEIVSNRFDNNSYSSFYKGKWQSHIMLYLSPMAIGNQEDIVRGVELVSKKLSKFKITLGDFEGASGNYLFIGVTDNPEGYIKYTHDELVKMLLSYRDSVIKEKYLQKWDSYSAVEQARIKNTGVPYEYSPHISVATLGNDTEVRDAVDLLENMSVEGLEFEADTLEIMVSGVNEYTDKEIIASIRIGQGES